jgi:hypothetical protein
MAHNTPVTDRVLISASEGTSDVPLMLSAQPFVTRSGPLAESRSHGDRAAERRGLAGSPTRNGLAMW